MSPEQLHQLQQALGPAWQALLSQQYVIGVQQLVIAGVLGGMVVILQGAGARTWAARTKDAFDDHGWVAVLAWVGSGILTLIAIGIGLDGAGHLLNPQGYAVQGIVDGLTHAH